ARSPHRFRRCPDTAGSPFERFWRALARCRALSCLNIVVLLGHRLLHSAAATHKRTASRLGLLPDGSGRQHPVSHWPVPRGGRSTHARAVHARRCLFLLPFVGGRITYWLRGFPLAPQACVHDHCQHLFLRQSRRGTLRGVALEWGTDYPLDSKRNGCHLTRGGAGARRCGTPESWGKKPPSKRSRKTTNTELVCWGPTARSCRFDASGSPRCARRNTAGALKRRQHALILSRRTELLSC